MSQKKQAASSARAGGITDGVIWEQLLVFFFPILFGAFFQQLYNTVDAVVVGRFTGSLELAAVQLDLFLQGQHLSGCRHQIQ